MSFQHLYRRKRSTNRFSVCIVSGVRLYFLLSLDDKDVSCKNTPAVTILNLQIDAQSWNRELLRRGGLERP